MLIETKFFQPDDVCHSNNTYDFQVDDVYIRSYGNTLHTKLLKHMGDYKGLIIHFHGNAKNITSHITHIDWLPQHGYDVLMFDYAGYGQSSGKPTRKIAIQNGIDVLDYAAKNLNISKKTIAIGQSLGASIAAFAIIGTRLNIDAFIIDSGFLSFREIVRHTVQTYTANVFVQRMIPMFVSTKYDLQNIIDKIEARILVMHGTQDTVVPYRFGEAISKLCQCDFWPSDSDHAEQFRASHDFRTKLLTWLDHIHPVT